MSAENACPRNTYREASGSTTCTECPLLSSADEASQSVTDCTCARFESRVARSCEAGCALCPEEPPGRVNGPKASPHRPTFAPGAAGFFMMDNLDADPSCALCPQPGANCTAPGATLSRLLLMPGYWRRSNTSIAVLACAAHRPCEPHAPLPFRPRRTPPGATRCPDAHRRDISGCGGGTAACREGRGLSGIYCTQCPEKQARQPAACSRRPAPRGTVLPPPATPHSHV